MARQQVFSMRHQPVVQQAWGAPHLTLAHRDSCCIQDLVQVTHNLHQVRSLFKPLGKTHG